MGSKLCGYVIKAFSLVPSSAKIFINWGYVKPRLSNFDLSVSFKTLTIFPLFCLKNVFGGIVKLEYPLIK